jgi:hypothetical protein
MKRREEKRKERFRRMRPSIGRHLLGTGAAAVVVVVVAICGGLLVHEGVAQVDDAPDDAILTVGRCIEVDASGSPLEEALVKEDLIEDDLLRTKVTNGMCEDMLERLADGSPVRRLVTAQNYIQEIELIEGAMREAAGEAAAKGTDRYASSDRPSIRFRAVAQTSEQVAAQAQYKEPGGNRTKGDGTRGDGTGGVEPGMRQAAVAASVGEDNDASIAERLRQKEAAAKAAGASVPEARAGARCSTEVEVSDDELKKGKGLYEIRPLMPGEMRLRESEQAGLLVSPATRTRFEQIKQKHRSIDDVSESGIGCVELVDRMKAQLVPLEEGLGYRRHHPDDIRELSSNRNTRWGWDIVARRSGNLNLLLDLRYAISRERQEFRLVPGSPVFEGEIRVMPSQSASGQEAKERPWWRRIINVFEGVLERIFGVSGA